MHAVTEKLYKMRRRLPHRPMVCWLVLTTLSPTIHMSLTTPLSSETHRAFMAYKLRILQRGGKKLKRDRDMTRQGFKSRTSKEKGSYP